MLLSSTSEQFKVLETRSMKAASEAGTAVARQISYIKVQGKVRGGLSGPVPGNSRLLLTAVRLNGQKGANTLTNSSMPCDRCRPGGGGPSRGPRSFINGTGREA